MELLQSLWHGLESLLSDLLHWVESFAGTGYGHWALFGVAFVESSFFPIPPDVLLIALCLARPSESFFFALLCSVGSILGGVLGYGIGYWGGRPVLRRFFNPDRVATVKHYYDKYDAWATGIAGLTPLPYKLFTISGGAFTINFKIFLLASVVSRSLRFFAVAAVMYFVGEPARAFIERYLNVLSIAFVLLLVAGFWLLGRWGQRARPPEPSGEAE